jgi:hypothetical protein
MANSRIKPKPWIDPRRISAAIAVANRPKPGRHSQYDDPDDDDEPAPPKPFDRRLRFKKKKEAR